MQQRLFEEALQFTHIAGPGIVPEHIQGLGSYLLHLFPNSGPSCFRKWFTNRERSSPRSRNGGRTMGKTLRR